MLQFQQKKSGGKKKKKAGSKSSKSKNEGDSVQQHSGEFGGNSTANSEHDVSIASADTEQDVSSFTSEVEEQIAHKQQVRYCSIEKNRLLFRPGYRICVL